MAKEWREVLAKRNRTSKTKRLYEDDQPTNKYSWDGMVGTSLHYEEVEGSDEWLEVDPRILPSGELGWDWEMRKSHWRFLVRNGGWFAAEKKGVGIGFRLERIAYLNIQTKAWQTIRTASYETPTVSDIEHGNVLLANPLGKLSWANLFPGVDFEIHVSGDRLHEEIKVSQAARDAMPAPPYPATDTYLVLVYEVDWGQVPGLADDEGDIDYDADFERTARLYLKNHQGEIISALPASRAWPEGEPIDDNSEPIEVLLRKRFIKIGGQHYLLVGAPILALNALPVGTIILDPDVDEVIGADENDGDRKTGSLGFDASGEECWAGYVANSSYYHMHIFLLWTSVTYEGTVTASYTEVKSRGYSGSPELIIHGVDEDNPAVPTSAAEFDADPLTAGVDWDSGFAATGQWMESPSLNTVFQALVDSYTISNDAVMLQIKNDGGAVQNYVKLSAREQLSENAAKLHIEFTAGGEGAEVIAVGATATAAALLSALRGDALVGGILGEATALGLLPVIAGDAQITGVLGESAAAPLVPTIIGGTGATVSAVLAESAAAALVSVLRGGALISGVLGEAAAAALTAAITTGNDATVEAVLATAIAAGLVPVIAGDALLEAVLAESTADGLVPTVAGNACVSALLAEAAGAALIAAVTGEASIDAILATAIAAGLVPTVIEGSGASVDAVLASSSADGLIPVLSLGATVSAVLAASTADGLLPTTTAGALIAGILAEATAAGLTPLAGIGATIGATLAEAVVDGLVPTITGDALISAVLSEAIAAGLVPAWIGPLIGLVSLSLRSRSLGLSLPERDANLSLRERDLTLTLEEL